METLYRKYRPIDFDSVFGQEAVTKTLKNQIVKGSIAHAYLFSGTRGTGKTTIAKIFARAINCPNEKNGNPCNVCNVCKSSIENTNLNIVEMDAASNRGIGDIRRISEQVAYPPLNNEKYKVFIIDEAHALTGDAAQAFLKILEEPPEYVVYILATTDPNKLPETILSRCQKFSFKRISIDKIVENLKHICDNEKILIDDDALSFIAEKSDGSMRESISKLDRCRAFLDGERLTKEAVIKILGIVSDEDFTKLLQYINTSDIANAFSILGACIEKGKDLIQLVNDFIWHLRNVLIVKDLKENIESLNITKINFDKYKKESETISKDTLIFYIEELSKTANSMKFDENRRVILETAIVRLTTPRSSAINESIFARLKDIEEKIEKNTFVSSGINSAINDTINENKIKEQKVEKIKEIKLPKATYEETTKVIDNWKAIISTLSILVKTILTNAKLIPQNENETGCIKVLLDDKYDYDLLNEKTSISEIEEALKNNAINFIKKDVMFKISCIENTNYAKDIKLILNEAYEKINKELNSDK